MPKSDQTFYDTVTIIVGALVLVALAIGIAAFVISGRTIAVSQKTDPAMRASILERIAPIGNVSVAGQDGAPAQPVAAPVEPEPVQVQAKSGAEVYNMACVACHAAGIAGAPKLGDPEAWATRLAQGMDVLNDHAINGYQGAGGVMPAKGGLVSLSDEEVIAAVQHMVDQSQ